ncbi:MAG: phage tail protein [Allosphingosinicella sp.]|uniref:phage tail protein n=1 Tax=Allosphingosinicella sp. TaxID=2823234 RepID=UPI00393B34D7
MAQPYVGEIRIFAGNFPPNGWMFCDGSTLSISENEVLFQLIGTTYGGDGESTFNLPDLRGRVPVHYPNNYTLGEMAGVEEVTLSVQQIPAHTHAALVSTAGGSLNTPAGNVVGASAAVKLFVEDEAATNFNPATIGPAGSSQPHTNFQPYLCVNFIISLFGIFPSPT